MRREELSSTSTGAKVGVSAGVGEDAAIAIAERSFARQPNKPTEFQTSIPQALALMNGRFVNDATALERSGTLAAVAGAPFLDAKGRVETLYLAALGRKPTAAESTKLVPYVEKGGPAGDPNQALADVFWALLNSSEFVFNH